MDLKGAELKNFYNITADIGEKIETAADISNVKIPHYQRPYRWGKEEIPKLVEDWESAKDKHKSEGGTKPFKYFAGAMVTVANKEDDYHELVDGQQRYTTTFLTNYLLMLILRVTIRSGLERKKVASIVPLDESLRKSLSHLFTDTRQEPFISEADIEGGINDEDERTKVISNYRQTIGLPEIIENDSNFLQEHKKLLSNFLNQRDLRISYRRSSYNKQLKAALSKVVITLSDQSNLDIKIDNDNDNDNSVESTFLKAVKLIFDSFKERVLVQSRSDDTFDNARKIINDITNLLDTVHMCVVQTGNRDDAYDLFEVLNDRSLALRDLDLIKNQFYRTYCIESGIQNDKDVDDHLDEFEEIWSKTFNDSLADFKEKLIAYFACSYILGSTTIDFKKNNEFRVPIKDDYLSQYKETNKPYKYNELKRDFNIFQMVGLLIEEFSIRSRSKDQKALTADKEGKTITYKLVHLLIALDHVSVLAGLFNFILKYIEDQLQLNTGEAVFDIENIKNLIQEISCNDKKHEDVQKQARQLWKSSLVNIDYNNPLTIAKSIIENSYRDSTNNQRVIICNDDTKTIGKNWANEFRFNDRNKLKVKLLMYRLITSSRLDKKLIFGGYPRTYDGLEHLDHLEPEHITTSRKKEYFIPDSNERIGIINSLGNMMILPAPTNQSKSNDPLHSVFDKLEEIQLMDHWLTQDIKDLLEENNESTSDDNESTSDDAKIPTIDFFNKRKEKIINGFKEAIDNQYSKSE